MEEGAATSQVQSQRAVDQRDPTQFSHPIVKDKNKDRHCYLSAIAYRLTKCCANGALPIAPHTEDLRECLVSQPS